MRREVEKLRSRKWGGGGRQVKMNAEERRREKEKRDRSRKGRELDTTSQTPFSL